MLCVKGLIYETNVTVRLLESQPSLSVLLDDTLDYWNTDFIGISSPFIGVWSFCTPLLLP